MSDHLISVVATCSVAACAGICARYAWPTSLSGGAYDYQNRFLVEWIEDVTKTGSEIRCLTRWIHWLNNENRVQAMVDADGTPDPPIRAMVQDPEVMENVRRKVVDALGLGDDQVTYVEHRPMGKFGGHTNTIVFQVPNDSHTMFMRLRALKNLRRHMNQGNWNNVRAGIYRPEGPIAQNVGNHWLDP